MRKIILFPSIIICTTVLLSNLNGAFPENTGAPGDLTCGRAPCHNIPVNVGTAQISIKVADSLLVYQPDSTYLVRVRITNQQTIRNGFEILALNENEQNVGQWILQDANKTQIKAGIGLPQRKYVTHKAAGNQQTEWFVKWKAPSNNAGSIIFYASVLASNNNGLNTGDKVYTTSTALTFSAVKVNEYNEINLFQVYPNPTSDWFLIQHKSQAPIDEVILYASNGNMVRRFENLTSQGDKLSASGLPAGVYYLKIATGNRFFYQKLMVE